MPIVETKNPNRGDPIAIGVGAVVAPVIFAPDAAPIAAILPDGAFSLQSGVFDTFSPVIPDIWHADRMEPALSMLVALGAVSGICAWLDGPPGASLRHDGVAGALSRILFTGPVAMDRK